MPINDSLIGAVTMKLSAPLPASTKSRVAGTSPHHLAFKDEEFPSKHLRPQGCGLCNATKWETAECHQPNTTNKSPGGAAETS
jgi:hypothetical protein